MSTDDTPLQSAAKDRSRGSYAESWDDIVYVVIEYDNHVRKARSAETRFKRAYLDPSKVKADAVELALSVS